MRGWKVSHTSDLSAASVGKTRGPHLQLKGCGWARGSLSDLHIYLVEELPQDWTDEHEKALAEKFHQSFGGSWVVVQGNRLKSDWSELTQREKCLLRRREGFCELDEWCPT